MPRYKFAFPVNNAILEDSISSFQVADVSFVKKSCLSEDFIFLDESKMQFKENQIFALVIVCGNDSYAKECAYDKCSFVYQGGVYQGDVYQGDGESDTF